MISLTREYVLIYLVMDGKHNYELHEKDYGINVKVNLKTNLDINYF